VAAQRLTVALIATLDTKGPEALLLAGLIRGHGPDVRIYDTGILQGPGPAAAADVTNEEIARAAGMDIEAVRELGSRGEAIAAMARGLSVLLPREHSRAKFQRAVVIGGLNGALVGAAGLQGLPFGVPKLIVTPIASGARQFAPFIGTADIAIMHSVVDLQGVNSFTSAILSRAASYISGPEAAAEARPRDRGALAITMNGNTTPVGMQILAELDRDGWEVVAFHSNGVGGSAMERLAAEGRFAALIDLTTNEIVDRELGGVYPGPETRMRILAGSGLPMVIVPGCMDFVNQNPALVPPGRLRTRHSPGLDLVRVTAAEARLLAGVFAESVNLQSGAVEVVVPTEGLSPSAVAGGPLADPAADAAFLTTLTERLDGSVPLTLVAAPINDPAVGSAVLGAFGRVVSRPSRDGVTAARTRREAVADGPAGQHSARGEAPT
jgi:uncharacterized protein (UPF0261 family)